jgi:nitroreductase
VNDPDILSVILKRRSVRAFLPDEIPREHIDQFIEALRWAPSAGNRQPWHFILVQRKSLRDELVKAAYGQSFIAQPPLLFVVCAIPEKSGSRYGKRGRELYVYQDTAAAIQNLMLLATGLGYGSCWIGAFDEREVSRILDLPPKKRPVAMIPVGKPAKFPSPTSRLSRDEVLTILE